MPKSYNYTTFLLQTISSKECLKEAGFVAGESSLLQLSFTKTQSKCKQWTDEEMAAAISIVRNGITLSRKQRSMGCRYEIQLVGELCMVLEGPRSYLSLDEKRNFARKKVG